jgi:menaquinone-specific isochorismate synthase
LDSILSQNFTKFLETVQSVKPSGTVLASYGFCVENFNLTQRIKKLFREVEKSFYWEKPAESFTIIGFGELISVSENGKGRFAAAEKKIRMWKDNFINNWKDAGLGQVPLFIGGMKFAHENPSEMWDNYDDANWFVPRIAVVKNGQRCSIIYNFLFSADSSKSKQLTDEFLLKTAPLLSGEVSDKNINHLPRIIGISGNTPKDKKRWVESIKKTLEMIEEGHFDKAVLSRYVEASLNEEPDLFTLTGRLAEKYPGCYIFAFHSGKSTFFGASPEKLIKLSHGTVEADALAGSIGRGANQDEDLKLENQLLQSEKDLREHNAVINYLKELFRNFAVNISSDPSPSVKKYLNIQHLFTAVKGNLKEQPKVLSLLESVHPTPAVCGSPQAEALNAIKKLEDYHRGLYAGITGWFNFEGEGEFSVAIRSALLKGKKIFAFAGGGIVEGSDPATEYRETELKLKPILSLFENENQS